MYAGATCTPFCTLDDVWAFELDSATWTLLHANGSPGSGGSKTGCLGAFDAVANRFVVTAETLMAASIFVRTTRCVPTRKPAIRGRL